MIIEYLENKLKEYNEWKVAMMEDLNNIEFEESKATTSFRLTILLSQMETIEDILFDIRHDQDMFENDMKGKVE